MPGKKVLVFGLDCATPQLVFDQWSARLPHLASLMQRGMYGLLRSCVPPITIPAWSCMMSGKHPGTLGCYGFRNRCDYSYDGLSFATSKAIRDDRVWDILSRARQQVILVGIPQTYPPTPVNGLMVSCFLTPDTSCQYTHPPELAREIQETVGDYLLDVKNFRTEDKAALLEQIYEMTGKRFALFKHFLRTKPWDFAMIVEMGIDRVHHGFWKYMDTAHPKHEQESPYAQAVFNYYRFLDEQIGNIVQTLDDRTVILVVSDHGAQTMRGGFCINEWLIREKYLVIAEKPDGVIHLNRAKIDWSRTQVWAEGGYYARLFMNVQGREPQGCIPRSDYERVRGELKRKLEETTDNRGKPLGTRVFRPEDVYAKINGIPPDLFVYFGDLAWRSIGSIGLNSLHTFENDLGPDDANHAEDGIFIMVDPGCRGVSRQQRRTGVSIVDIAPTILDALGLPVPPDMEGSVINH